MKGLDGRHRDRDGRIQKKRSDAKMKNLKSYYPELKNFGNESTLGEVCARQGVADLDQLLRKQRQK
jgi:hypothetical protein